LLIYSKLINLDRVHCYLIYKSGIPNNPLTIMCECMIFDLKYYNTLFYIKISFCNRCINDRQFYNTETFTNTLHVKYYNFYHILHNIPN